MISPESLYIKVSDRFGAIGLADKIRILSSKIGVLEYPLLTYFLRPMVLSQ